jgi:phosphorylcholine metabolism protein LicD
MGGIKNSRSKLNHTLSVIINLLNNHNIKNWFISYGTLLGIVRENSCIDNDDDIDITSNINDYDKIKQLLQDNGFTFIYLGETRTIIKTVETPELSSIDFYMAQIDNAGNYDDKWTVVNWTNCYLNDKLIEYNWNGQILYLPNNYETKLVNRYGEDWKIPQQSKGPTPAKYII